MLAARGREDVVSFIHRDEPVHEGITESAKDWFVPRVYGPMNVCLLERNSFVADGACRWAGR